MYPTPSYPSFAIRLFILGHRSAEFRGPFALRMGVCAISQSSFMQESFSFERLLSWTLGVPLDKSHLFTWALRRLLDKRMLP